MPTIAEIIEKLDNQQQTLLNQRVEDILGDRQASCLYGLKPKHYHNPTGEEIHKIIQAAYIELCKEGKIQ